MREIKIYKVKNSDNLFWTGKYKKMDNRGKSWLDYNDLTRDLNRLKNIPEDWAVVEIHAVPYYYREYTIPRVKE